jgi:antitoxin MazE
MTERHRYINEKGMRTMTTSTLRKWGNSMGIRIPAHFVKILGMEEGTEVEVILSENQIVLRPVSKQEHPDRIREKYLDKLSKARLETERHEEIDFGTAGREEIDYTEARPSGVAGF